MSASTTKSAAAMQSPHARTQTSVTGIWILLAATVMLFAAFTSAMVVRKGAANDWVPVQLPAILYGSTVLLAAGSVFLAMVRRGLHSAMDKQQEQVKIARRNANAGVALALLTGLGFLVCQWLAFRQVAARGISLASSPGSSFFFLFTVSHAVHVLGGLFGLSYLLWHVSKRQEAISSGDDSAVASAALYWHFMNGLWIYILVLLTVKL